MLLPLVQQYLQHHTEALRSRRDREAHERSRAKAIEALDQMGDEEIAQLTGSKFRELRRAFMSQVTVELRKAS